jgi:hypothetical protein
MIVRKEQERGYSTSRPPRNDESAGVGEHIQRFSQEVMLDFTLIIEYNYHYTPS